MWSKLFKVNSKDTKEEDWSMRENPRLTREERVQRAEETIEDFKQSCSFSGDLNNEIFDRNYSDGHSFPIDDFMDKIERHRSLKEVYADIDKYWHEIHTKTDVPFEELIEQEKECYN